MQKQNTVLDKILVEVELRINALIESNASANFKTTDYLGKIYLIIKNQKLNEVEQIRKAFAAGQKDGIEFGTKDSGSNRSFFEKYYEETFN